MILLNRKPPSFSKYLLFFFFFCIVIFFSACPKYSTAQSTPNATLVPSEVRALNTIFQKWNIQPTEFWNISGEPCTGTALTTGEIEFDEPQNNPGIRCDCSYNRSTQCHITRLRVYEQDITGELPEELLQFPYLVQLKVDRNYLTGPLPAFIGNLTRLGLLSLAQNVFSGPIPKEIGNLKKLFLLSLGHNNFSGTLPPELGNLVELGELYINSCGLGGEIPSTFANLESLRILWASDSAFTGKVPDFIGNLTRLTDVRLEGNSFVGPIPSSFANLTSLVTLRINGVYNGSSSLGFIRNLKNLTDLVLRNVLLTGTIPSSISELRSLKKLDLSFNNLTGQIPSSLFTMNSLENLFLGNNSLTGTIPSQKSGNLRTIDLSYNLLSGNLPSWVNSDLELNFVANNFTISRENLRILPGLDCLQRGFPCFKNAPRYANFSIKCGDRAMRANGILFEADNGTLGPATHNVTNTQKWAVSNVGMFAEGDNQRYVITTLAQVRSNNPALFQTSRISPGSLRYYGLGLQNGLYNVTLLFAETGFPPQSTQTWKSRARRVFDIHVQKTLRLKDFDISKEAGGVQVEIAKNFIANVTENHLEIHLFWAGKGTCCSPDLGYYGPLISAINVAPTFRPTVSGLPPGNPKNKQTGLIVGITVPVASVALILIFAIIYVNRRKVDEEDEEVLLGIGSKLNTFSYSELKAATEDFSPANKLGEGGFGSVYKGTLSDERVVAVKQLSVASHQGKSQFVTEIATISAVQHRNLVKLHGCCIEGNRRILVYEYLANKSLDQALFGKSDVHLDWPTRFNICLSTARGLAYLHEESRPRIVHRDVKASNILLDAELCPKISDFGLAKLYDDKKTHISTRVAGTIGYLAPEYAMRGRLTEKADVFGFGVVALEILSGRPNSDHTLDNERVYLLEWAWTLHENNQSLNLVDPTLLEFDENEALRVMGVALLCTQASPSLRPSMSRVIAMLTGDAEVSSVTTKPSYLTDWDFEDISGTFMHDEDTDTPSAYDSSNVKSAENKSFTETDEPKVSQ